MPLMQEMEQVLPKQPALPTIVEGDVPGQLPPIEKETSTAEELEALEMDEKDDLLGELPAEVEPVVAEPVLEPKVVEGEIPAEVPVVKAEPAPVEVVEVPAVPAPVEEIKVVGEDDDTDLFGQAPEIGQPEAPVAETALAAVQQLFGEGGKGQVLHDVLETFAKLFESLANLDEVGKPAEPVVLLEPAPVELLPEVVPAVEVAPLDMFAMEPAVVEPLLQPA